MPKQGYLIAPNIVADVALEPLQLGYLVYWICIHLQE